MPAENIRPSTAAWTDADVANSSTAARSDLAFAQEADSSASLREPVLPKIQSQVDTY
jgi:hypothetical protein